MSNASQNFRYVDTDVDEGGAHAAEDELFQVFLEELTDLRDGLQDAVAKQRPLGAKLGKVGFHGFCHGIPPHVLVTLGRTLAPVKGLVKGWVKGSRRARAARGRPTRRPRGSDTD